MPSLVRSTLIARLHLIQVLFDGVWTNLNLSVLLGSLRRRVNFKCLYELVGNGFELDVGLVIVT